MNSHPSSQPRASRAGRATLTTYLVIVLLGAAGFLLILKPYLLSVGAGAILAAACYPAYTRLRRRMPPWGAASLITGAVVVLVLVPFTALLVATLRQGALALAANEGAPTLVEVVERVRGWAPFVDTFGDPGELLVYLREGTQQASGSLSTAMVHGVQGFPGLVVQLAVLLLTTWFGLVDGRSLYRWIGDRLPLPRAIRSRLGAAFLAATRDVVVASLAAAGAQAGLMFVAFTALGVPGALLAGGGTFILGWVPALPTVVWFGGAAWLFAGGSVGKALVMVGFGLVIGLVDNLVRAVVLRGRRALHPLIGLVSILGGIAVLGVPGLFVGPLAACLVIALLEIWPTVADQAGILVTAGGQPVPDMHFLDEDGP